MKKETIVTDIRLGKLVHGGQCLGEMPSGKKILVWGGLPGELVSVRIIKKKSSYAEGVVSEVVEPSKERVVPEEPASYLSTSPWQIMSFESENIAKQSILVESFEREKISNVVWVNFVSGVKSYEYRNKQEFGFWGDEMGIHLAHFVRGTHGKQIVDGSKLANPLINKAAADLISKINEFSSLNSLRAGDLKTLVLRCSGAGETVGALFVKEELDMSDFELPDSLKGLVVYYSNPKSPASVPTRLLYSLGDIKLTDKILGINITYDVMSFFQVNIPVFEMALQQIKTLLQDNPSVDVYSGVGTIGLAVGSSVLVETDKNNLDMAKLNTAGTKVEAVQASAEEALQYIVGDKVLICDPPRAGLHQKVIDRIIEVQPSQIIYLSCNPSTQARDVKLLEDSYKISYAQGFNFFPRTPHIESLVVLERI